MTQAITNPQENPNNKFGIHIISATKDEAKEAAQLVNSSGGDWGYITVLIESDDRNRDKWQNFFNDLRRLHLIPIVRIATKPINDYWERPYEKEYEAWADFLNELNWPTKNRYIVVYNEPNHAKEWGGTIDPASYALVLDQIISALKAKSTDFFVLNAGFDASAPHKPPEFYDEERFLIEMNKVVPGIFEKLDGWTSHSYPNPGFKSQPTNSGRGTVRGYVWELNLISRLGVKKDLSVFMTETGWKHAEGLTYDGTLPSSERVGTYLQTAFKDVWADSRIIAVTPFILNYQDEPFDHFSFKKPEKKNQNLKILGQTFPEYYPQHQALLSLTKPKGLPLQENKAEFVKGGIYRTLVTGESYKIPLTVKNIGQSIWNDKEQIKLKMIEGQNNFELEDVEIPQDIKIEPGQEFTFILKLKAPEIGEYKLGFNLFVDDESFDSGPFEFDVEVKPPVILLLHSKLLMKSNFAGEYILLVNEPVGENFQKVILDSQGRSPEVENLSLLPGQKYQFILQKPFYKAKRIEQIVHSGENSLDFGALKPDILLAIFKLKELLRLLPFLN